MSENQGRFDFDRAEQMGMIDRAALPAVKGISNIVLGAVLRCIDSHGHGRESWPSVRTIAAKCRCGERTVKRALAALAELSLLVTTKRRSTAGAVCNHYRIVWSELALLIPRSEPPALAAVSADDRAERGATVSERGAMQALAWGLGGPLSSKEVLKKSPPPGSEDGGSPRLAPAADKIAGSKGEEVLELVEEVLTLGVFSGECVRADVSRTSAEHVRELVAWYRSRPGQYGPGALAVRLTRARCALPVGEGWPPCEPTALAAGGPRRVDPVLELNLIEARIVRAGRRAGASEAEIEARVRAARQRYRQEPAASAGGSQKGNG